MTSRKELLTQAVTENKEFLNSWNANVMKHMKTKHKGLPATGCHVCAMASLSIISAKSNIRDFEAELAELSKVDE